MIRLGRGVCIGTVMVATSAVALGLFASPVMAETVDVVVDSSPVQLVTADGGTHKTSVGITNVSDEVVRFSADTVNDDPGCTITPSQESIDPATQTKVTFTFDTGCNTDGGIEFFIQFADPAVPESIELRAKPAPAAASPDWEILGLAALFAGVGTLLVLVLILSAIGKLNQANDDADATTQRTVQQWLEYVDRYNARTMVGLAAPNPPSVPPERPPIRWGTNMPGLGTSWSFKDSWVSNVTLGAAALVALVAASDVLNPVLGDDAKPVIGLVAVVAGITAVFVTIGPLVLKAFGSDVGIPTVGGTITAAAAVVAGTLFQISALTIQSGRLVENELLQFAIAVGGIAIAFVVGRYAVHSVGGLIRDNLTKARRSISDPERAALIIYAAMNPGMGEMPMTPATVADILASDPEFAELGLGSRPGDAPGSAAI